MVVPSALVLGCFGYIVLGFVKGGRKKKGKKESGNKFFVVHN